MFLPVLLEGETLHFVEFDVLSIVIYYHNESSTSPLGWLSMSRLVVGKQQASLTYICSRNMITTWFLMVRRLFLEIARYDLRYV